MLLLTDIFNDESLNIFTDASMNSYGTIGCAGFIAVHGGLDKRFPMLHTESRTQIIKKATNNISEARAVIMGLYEAIVYQNRYKHIRIFSDSQITILGIRDRIYNWKVSKKTHDRFVGSGGAIKNQDLFLEMLYIILENNLSVEFWHQGGHVNFNDQSSIDKATHVFTVSNNIRDTIDIELIRAISYYNNFVDRNTREILYSTDLLHTNPVFPIKYKYCGFDRERLYNLTHPNNTENNNV